MAISDLVSNLSLGFVFPLQFFTLLPGNLWEIYLSQC